MIKKKYLIVDISGKVDLYDKALVNAIKKIASDASVRLLIPGNGLMSLIPRKYMTSTSIIKRLIKVVEGLLNYAYTLVIVSCLRPQILHMQWLPFLELKGWEIPILKLLKKLSPETKFILTIHNIYPHNIKEDAKKTYNIRFRKVSILFDAFIVHTKASKDIVIKEFELSPNIISICCHGVFVPQGFSKSNHQIGEIIHILQFGGQSYYKGTDILVDAICGLDDKRKLKIETHIVGGISQSFLKELIIKDKESCIKWKPYFLKDDDLFQEIQNSDIVVLPYRTISQSGVLLLSIYFEKLIICSDLPSFVETMRGDEDDSLDKFLFFKTENAESLRNLLERYIDRSIDEKAIHARVKHLNGIYSWDNAAKATLDVYKSN